MLLTRLIKSQKMRWFGSSRILAGAKFHGNFASNSKLEKEREKEKNLFH